MTRRFTVRTTDLCSQVLDKTRMVYVAEWDAIAYPDHVERAQAAADELEARLNPPPEWGIDSVNKHQVNGPGGSMARCYGSGGWAWDALAARVAYLLNTYGLDGDA